MTSIFSHSFTVQPVQSNFDPCFILFSVSRYLFSAGVGRTGTFISLDTLINQMDRENKVDIYNTVLSMRMKRKEMVQTVVCEE